MTRGGRFASRCAAPSPQARPRVKGDDAGDYLVVNTTFSSTSTTFAHDDAGNLVDDGTFIYTYDAWNRLVKATGSEDSNVVIGTYSYDGQGRRIKKVVTNSGDLDGTELYYYGSVAASVLAGRSQWQVIEVRDGSENVVRQVMHGTRYIDEAVLEILGDGVAWVHQDANWNVLALTDFAGRTLERYEQTPYGVITVDQNSYFGDYDGDSLITLAEVDTNTNGSLGVGDTCWGSSPSGDCRLLDFDFDDDVDNDDKTVFDTLVSADTYRSPGRTTSALGNARAHQGLILDAEIGSFNNRARQYAPALKAFVQRDPLATTASTDEPYQDGLNVYQYVSANPVVRTDPTGEWLGQLICRIFGICPTPTPTTRRNRGPIYNASCNGWSVPKNRSQWGKVCSCLNSCISSTAIRNCVKKRIRCGTRSGPALYVSCDLSCNACFGSPCACDPLCGTTMVLCKNAPSYCVKRAIIVHEAVHSCISWPACTNEQPATSIGRCVADCLSCGSYEGCL